jgi:hypothetical protein
MVNLFCLILVISPLAMAYNYGPVDCYKNAIKLIDPYSGTSFDSVQAIKLCQGSISSNAPIDCYNKALELEHVGIGTCGNWFKSNCS